MQILILSKMERNKKKTLIILYLKDSHSLTAPPRSLNPLIKPNCWNLYLSLLNFNILV